MALNFPNSPTLNQVYTDTTSGFSYQWNGTVWISFSAASSNQIKVLDDISGSFTGIAFTFALTSSSVSIAPLNAQSLIINLGGVIQDPTDDYSVTGSNIIFSTAPTSGLSFSGISLGPAIPIDYANNGNVYTRSTFTATAGQTTFTVTGTYTVGYLDVYQNGVRLSAGTDYTATTGTTFVLTTPANLNDEIESIGYKVASIVTTTGQFDNLIISGVSTFIGFATHTGTIFGNNLSLTGIATASSVIVGSAVTINSSGINVTGITTIKNASGTVTIGIGTTALLVEGNARVTGILTVGSASITLNGITDTINVGTGLTLSSSGINVTGVVTATSFVGDGSGLTGVGIGSTGSINTSGIITATTLTAGNVTISSGIVTATSGVTTYFGDGSKLSGISASGTLLRAPQVLTSGTSYTTPAGCTAVYVECVGGGGAGGGTGSAESSGSGGGGGGAGGYCAKYFTVSPSTSYTYAIGSGGSGTSEAPGNTGGSTTFTVSATTITASGGGGGGNTGTGSLAGTGGNASGGDINATGSGGQGATNSGVNASRWGGSGGSSFFGGAGRGPGYSDSPTAGGNGSAGGGGGGAVSYSGGGSRAGGNGGNGLIRIWEYS